MSSRKKSENIFNPLPAGVLGLVLIILALELFCQIFGVDFRSFLLIYLAFFPLNLDPNYNLYTGQFYISFFSYAFLHINFFHMIINVSIIVALGKKIEKEIGYISLIALFLLSSILGAFFFLLVPSSSQHLPMLGASGSAFGFLGYWKGRELFFRLTNKLPLQPVTMFFLVIILANFFMVLFFPIAVAWQAHLGGFLCGILVAFICR